MKIQVWHPESPGMKNIVYRNWFWRLILSKYFATLNESIKSSMNCHRPEYQFCKQTKDNTNVLYAKY